MKLALDFPVAAYGSNNIQYYLDAPYILTLFVTQFCIVPYTLPYTMVAHSGSGISTHYFVKVSPHKSIHQMFCHCSDYKTPCPQLLKISHSSESILSGHLLCVLRVLRSCRRVTCARAPATPDQPLATATSRLHGMGHSPLRC